MDPLCLQQKRVLAIDPTSRGFGFAILEGPGKLIDWGMKQFDRQKQKLSVLKSQQIIENYFPDIIVVEDWNGKGSRRCPRIGRLIKAIRELGTKRHIPTHCFCRDRIRQAFASHDARTKRQIAIVIALQLPELRPRIPRARKTWMTEDERMTIFDAVALALTYYHFAAKRRRKAM